jgi:Holliday junction resolvasome RuvABC endonuclease subunit
MKVLSLDLSTKSGWSVIQDGKLISYGLVTSKIIGDETSENYPHNYIAMAKALAEDLLKVAQEIMPDHIVIEETNKGKNRYSQKCLEFIHFALNDRFKAKVNYIDTSEWRWLLGISLDKEQRKDNKEISTARKEELEKCYKICCEHNKLSHELELSRCLKKREANKIKKTFERAMMLEAKKMMRSYRYKEDGKVKGKINSKTLSVNYVNEYFNLKFKKKDNDIADSICLGLAFIKKLGAQQ